MALDKLVEMYQTMPEKFKTYIGETERRIYADQYTIIEYKYAGIHVNLDCHTLCTLAKIDENRQSKCYKLNNEDISQEEYDNHPIIKIFNEVFENLRKQFEQIRCEKTLAAIKIAHKTNAELREEENSKREEPKKQELKKIEWFTVNSIRNILNVLLFVLSVLSLIFTLKIGYAIGWFLGLVVALNVEHYYNLYVNYKNRNS